MDIRQIRMSIFEENMLGEGPGIKAGGAKNLFTNKEAAGKRGHRIFSACHRKQNFHFFDVFGRGEQ